MNRNATAPLPIRSGATASGKEVRALVRWAIERRADALRFGWGRLESVLANAHMGRLSQWLDRNPLPSNETLLRFDRELGTSLRYVMPGNAAGKAKLAAYQSILFNM